MFGYWKNKCVILTQMQTRYLDRIGELKAERDRTFNDKIYLRKQLQNANEKIEALLDENAKLKRQYVKVDWKRLIDAADSIMGVVYDYNCDRLLTKTPEVNEDDLPF